MTRTPREILDDALLYEPCDVEGCMGKCHAQKLEWALTDLKEAVLAAIGEDEGSVIGPGVPGYQRNQLSAELRKAILTMFEGE